MGKKKKGILNSIFNFIKSIFGAVKWTIKKINSFSEWLLNSFEKEKSKKMEKELEGKRPKVKANYKPFLELEAEQGSLEDFEEKLYNNKSLVGLVLGSRGSGKSAVGMRVLENIKAKSGKTMYCMGFEKNDLPYWIHNVKDLKDVKTNSFILIDEGGIEFSSRDTMKNANKLLSKLLLISRHNDLSILFISQNSSNIEINTIRQSDYLILKKPSLLQIDFERNIIKKIYAKISKGFTKYKKEKGVCYIYSSDYKGFLSNQLPDFWTEKISKAYRKK